MARDRLPPIEFEPVDELPSSSSSAPEDGDERARRRPRRPGQWVAAGVVIVLVLVAATMIGRLSDERDRAEAEAAQTRSELADARRSLSEAEVQASTTPVSDPPPSRPFLVDLSTGTRTPLPVGLAEGFSAAYANVLGVPGVPDLHFDPVPSPDGRHVVALVWCTSAVCGSDRMAVGHIDGTAVRTIGPPAGMRLVGPGPSWSPDGTRIVYDARDDGTHVHELFIEDVATGDRSQITHLDLDYRSDDFPRSPTFTRDGQTVLFMLPSGPSCCRGDVWSVPMTGGEPTLLIENAAWPAPLTDGKTVAFVSGRGTDPLRGGIWLASIDDPSSARPLVLAGPFITGLWASPDGSQLMYRSEGGVPPDGFTIIDAATGVLEYRLEGAGAVWLDNDTLIVTEVRPD